MDINLEHEVGVLSCFSLLFHFCVVYVKGNRIYYSDIYVLMKFFALISSNLRNGLFLSKYCKNQAERSLIISHVFFCNHSFTGILLLLKCALARAN